MKMSSRIPSALDILKNLVNSIDEENTMLRNEANRLAERYRLIELANKEWTRNDAVEFGKLYEENIRLRKLYESDDI